MKIFLIILFLPLAAMAQNKDSTILHRATDSLFYFWCRQKCAIASKKWDSVAIYGAGRHYYEAQAIFYYHRWDKLIEDNKRQKHHMRFLDPDKYAKCSCK